MDPRETAELSVEVRPIDEPARGGELEALLNASFKVPLGSSYFDDFPVWDPVHAADIVRLGAFTLDGKLTSAACLRFAKIRGQTREIPVGILGSVATGEAWRGKGYASLVLEDLIKGADRRGLEAIFLWGSEHSLYERFGFGLCGIQGRAPIAQLPRAALSTQLKLRTGWHPVISNLLRLRSGGLLLSERDLAWIGAHKNIAWYWITGANNEPLAFAAYGKGIDLPGMIHEWGAKTQNDFRALLTAMVAYHGQAEILGPPAALRDLGFPDNAITQEHLCLARVRATETPAQYFGEPGGSSAREPIWLWGLDSA